jgi:Protein of unknown function (DUF1573)
MGSRWTRALVAVQLLVLAARPSSATAQPQLLIDGPVFDFGRVDQGMTVDHVFRLLNQGTTPLRLDEVRASCDCTLAEASATEIPPGQSAQVSVRLDTLRIAGPTTKTITIRSNDPAVPVAGLSLVGQVLTDAVAAPPMVFLGRFPQGRTAQYEVVVAAGRPEVSVSVTEVRSASRYLTARLEADGDGLGQKVVVEISPEIPIGNFNAEVVISTTSARTPTVVVPVFGVVEGAPAPATARRG